MVALEIVRYGLDENKSASFAFSMSHVRYN